MAINGIIVQYFSPYILLFTQAPILVCSMILTIYYYYYYYSGYMMGYDWWLCMAINISVQYNGGLLPDIIILLLC